MVENHKVYDVMIIGGGTTGLFTAFYCGMRGMTTKLIESGSQLGGKVRQFLPEKLIYDIGGIPQITGDDLVHQMEEQASKNQPTIIHNQWIETITKNEDALFSLVSTEGIVHQAKTVIVATGTGRFDPVKFKLEDCALYEQKSLHYTISNLEQFSGKRVMVSSNNRVGIEWALTLEDIAEKVYLVNSKKTFQHATDLELHRLYESSVTVTLDSHIAHLHGENGWLEKVITKSNHQTEESIEVDHLLVYNGLKMNPAPFDSWDLKTESNKVVVDHHMATNIKGIFAAGDATSYPGKTMLIASGYTEGLTAANSAKAYLEPKAPAQVYSTVIYR
ncbi:NAD(P)/FAD-dependent oxidoreductase [Aquibacillus sp. 3ASR75-11]|uniref:Ferredoxin--NADP reductase n=1 Tax=Terrihalobacillus insolitus TaxID=2950438 RepID=A0A9X3WUA6_9BACI|nr:NAD(P)/FAD-dependent oxidoreductase [Terrihalobacillus insolitus]MDC3414498.1 NAD(P)/FAD-dependent oxidoreductase [Terrihalobacillus insolitus]MDC3426057.1 NAD(P)/FAD-dependent oxidoreductase [Terrihalobacillus insolitus]